MKVLQRCRLSVGSVFSIFSPYYLPVSADFTSFGITTDEKIFPRY